MRKHRDLIDAEANAINMSEAKSFRRDQLENFTRWRADRSEEIDRQEKDRLLSYIREAVAWLNAVDTCDDTLTRLLRHCDEAHWVFKQPTVLDWLDKGRHQNFLWVNGKPGAGKLRGTHDMQPVQFHTSYLLSGLMTRRVGL